MANKPIQKYSKIVMFPPYLVNENLFEGEGVQGQKSWKHDFEITGDPKGPPSRSTFWSGFEI